MNKIETNNAPAAIGPYVQGMDLGSLVITSGQLPINPTTKSIPESAAEQTQQSLSNVLAILEQVGLDASNIVKTTVFVKDLNEFTNINAVYEAFFVQNDAQFPARSCVEVARSPTDAKVEMEVIAIRS